MHDDTKRPPGVDLSDSEQRSLIDRIYWARWAAQVRAGGLDADDVLQQIYMGFVTRNQGKRPWDPEISSLSNYAYIVMQSVVRNALDSHRRAERRGWVCGRGGDVATWEVAGLNSWRAMDPVEMVGITERLSR